MVLHLLYGATNDLEAQEVSSVENSMAVCVRQGCQTNFVVGHIVVTVCLAVMNFGKPYRCLITSPCYILGAQQIDE